jgi:hypothetical protein
MLFVDMGEVAVAVTMAAMVLATVIPHIHPDPVPRRMMV